MTQATSHGPKPPDLSAGLAGASASVPLNVMEEDTASRLASGDVPVLGTPRLVALCEEASCRAIAGRLPAGKTTVAWRVQFDHLVPVPIGARVVGEATLEKVEGRRMVFTISVARDDSECAGPVAVGRLTRVVVERDAFLAKAGCSR